MEDVNCRYAGKKTFYWSFSALHNFLNIITTISEKPIIKRLGAELVLNYSRPASSFKGIFVLQSVAKMLFGTMEVFAISGH